MDDHSATLTDGGEGGAPAAPGGTVGRFVVLGALGAGGMGVVVAAWDPTLDRRVALKLLKAGVAGDGRLEREAQAMARLQHPNVAAVYEIGSVAERRFVAMELVEGGTLKTWMQAQHDWREVVAMFAAAGRGLEAAHAAGLVHRDFKPDNVLVGNDGRPRVSDFGLASAGASTTETSHTGAFGGTPAYMSPEQMRGEPANARSDQFSYCVALWEALFGKRPFESDAEPADRRAPASPPRGREVPAWVQAIVARGLSTDAGERWPSMSALLDALAQDPAARRRGIISGALVVGLLGLAAAAGFGVLRPSPRCTGAAARLAGVWDAPRKQQLEQSFLQSGAAAAADAWGRARGILDGYAQRWVRTHEEACRATVDGRQSEALLDLRMTCLDRRRTTLAALGDLWSGKLNEKAVDGAATAATALPPPEECSDVEALTAPLPLPKDAAQKAKIAAVYQHLDRIRALAATSKWPEAATEAAAARKEADAIGHAPLTAEAALQLAVAKFRLNEPVAAELAEEAARQGALARDDHLTAEAMIQAVLSLAYCAGKPDQAQEFAHAAEAAVLRAGDPPVLRGKLLAAQGRAYLDGGKPKLALSVLEPAVALLEKNLGANAADTFAAQSRLASTESDLGEFDKARATDLRLVEVARSLGVDTPREAATYLGLGLIEEHSGRPVEARAWYEKSKAIYIKRLGPENASIANIECNLANLDLFEGKLEQAAERYLKVKDMLLRLGGNDFSHVADVINNLSAVRVDQGRVAEALSLSEQALAMAEKTYGKDHTKYAMFEDGYATALIAKKDYATAHARLEHAVAVTTASLGADNPVTLAHSTDLAVVDIHLGRCAKARPVLEKIAASQVKQLGPSTALAVTLEAVATCDEKAHDLASAEKNCVRAIEMQKKYGAPNDVKRVEEQLARLRR